MDLYFLQYNNYYNRLLKVGSNYLPDYREYIIDTLPNTNFNPNDGVSTTHIAPLSNQEFPDYMLACEGNQIRSRWYVIETVRLRTGQYQLTLYRDLLADFYNEVKEATIFVEKGPLPINSSLLFNREDMTTSQVRQTVKGLYDATKVPWIVGYVPSNATFTGDIQSKYTDEMEPNFIVDSIDEWEYAKYLDTDFYSVDEKQVVFSYTVQNNLISLVNTVQNYTKYYSLTKDSIGEESQQYTTGKWKETPKGGSGYNKNDNFANGYGYDWETAKEEKLQNNDPYSKIKANSTLISYLDGFITNNYAALDSGDTFEELSLLQNQVIKIADEYSTINVNIEPFEDTKTLSGQSAIVSELNKAVPARDFGGLTDNTFKSRAIGMKLKLTLTDVKIKIKTNISDDRSHLEDQPYDMFCIPYGEVFLYNGEGEGQGAKKSKSIGTSLAADIAAQMGKDSIYDVQILPYCPVPEAWDENYGWIDLTRTKHSLITTAIGDQRVSALIWCRRSSFTFNIPLSIPEQTNPVYKKLESQTKLYRLVAPNYTAAFDFDPQKNNGVNYLRVDCSYKPFSPYIRVAPVFGGLYGVGGQYDNRGLILQGDYSISQVSNAWADYQLQNKNFNEIFKREMSNLDVNNKAQRANDIFSAIAGTAQGGSSGALSGYMISALGGPVGVGTGIGVGAGGSILTGLADIFINEKLRNEAVDFANDMFGYQLGNIQALPNTLTKSSVLNINNMLVPMLEIYGATPEEEQAFINKLHYNGMTVMTIGALSQYLGVHAFGEGENYFKGKLIRINVADDSHIINAIANELNKGVYI